LKGFHVFIFLDDDSGDWRKFTDEGLGVEVTDIIFDEKGLL
jgi:hypothetical protein